MSRSFRWVGFESMEELSDMIPRLAADTERDTALFNATRWRSEGRLAHAVQMTKAFVGDYDGTAIAGSHWAHLRARLREPHRSEDEADVAAYFRGARTDASDQEFLGRCAQRLVASRLARSVLDVDAARQLPRRGTQALFRSYAKHLTAIVSFGVRPYIERWSVLHDVGVGRIFALALTWDPHGDDEIASGWDPSTGIVEATKARALDLFSQVNGLDGHEVLVAEDTPRMLARMKHPNNVGVLIVPRADPQEARAEERRRQLLDPELFGAFDLVLVSDTLEPLVAMRGGHL